MENQENEKFRVEFWDDGQKYLVCDRQTDIRISSTELLKYLPKLYGDNKNLRKEPTQEEMEGFFTNPSTSEETLTERQRDLLRFVQDYRDKEGISPTYREISEHLNINIPSVYEHVIGLEKKGIINHKKYCSRSILPLTRI